MIVEIHIYGPVSKLQGDFKVDAAFLDGVRDVTSYEVAGAEWSQAYRKKLWDGKKHLMKKNGAFPTGLVGAVKEAIESYGIEVPIIDHRKPPPTPTGDFTLEGITFDYPYEYQLDAAKACIEKQQGIVRIATGGGKTELACAVTKCLQAKTLFIVNTQELLFQARERFQKRLGVGDEEIGIVGAGYWQIGSWVTIATIDTLESRIDKNECQKFLETIEVLFVDECHHLGSETWYQVCMLCPAIYRFGLSGTPLDRTDGADLRLIAAMGGVIVDIDNSFLVERGVSARANIIWDQITKPPLRKAAYQTAYKKGVVENEYLIKRVIEWTKLFRSLDLSVLILLEEIKHGERMDAALWTDTDGEFIPHQFICGEESKETRQQALKAFGDRSLPVLVASTILDEGVDVPTIDVLICAGSRKSKIKTLQRLGRGLRGDRLIVVEFANFTNDYLLRHSLKRLEDYKKEKCFPIHTSGPDLDLVKKILETS